MSEQNLPQHPFEVTVQIGGNSWEYVERTLHELAQHVKEHGQDCSMCSGGWDGSYSVNIRKRDISADAYRTELCAWRESMKR